MPGSQSDHTRLAWVCATALAVFVAWIATAATANAGIAFFYVVPIGLATWWFGRRAGAIAVAACCCLYALGGLVHPIDGFIVAFPLRLIAFVATLLLASFLHDRLLALEHSAEDLEAIRAALTPATLPDLPDVDAAAAFVPSEHGVSGDFYLLTNGPDGATLAIVGDVVGHGPEAARLATFVRARFAAFAAGTSDPAELLTLVNGALAELPGRERELVSAVCLRFAAPEARLSWAVAGHPRPLRLPRLEELECEGGTFLLGAEPGLSLSNAETVLGGDEGVVLYTDGATDVRRRGQLLGAEGLAQLLAPLAELPAPVMISRIERAILEWADGPIRDDLCLLALRPKA